MKILPFLFLLFALHYPSLTSGQTLWNTETNYPKREIRAVWLTTLSGLDWPKTKATSDSGRASQQQELCDMLDRLKACNINTILLQTRIRGSVIYPSRLEPWDRALTGTYGKSPGYDPLAFAIEEAHKRGMELHAWIVAIPAFRTEVAGKMGANSLLKTHPNLLKKYKGTYYLDPGEPATAQYLADVCREIVENYDVDGLHFDYIRYPENARSFPDAGTYKKYGKGEDKAQWRRDNITHIVRETYEAVKQLKTWVKMSCSPIGKFRDLQRYSSHGWNAYDAVYQDAQGWLRDSIQDILFPMMYFTGNHFYPFVLDWKEGSHGRLVAPGLGVYLLSPQEKDWDFNTMSSQLHYVRDNALEGQCFFRTEFLLANHKGICDFLCETFYAYPALIPACPWLDSEAPSAPTSATCRNISAQLAELTWETATDNLSEAGKVRYNIYASHSYPVDITRAENIVATYLTEEHFVYDRTLCMNIAVTAIDRCGNESEPLQLGRGDGATPYNTTARSHFMAHDGESLKLPDSPDISSYSITDIAGRTLISGKWGSNINISELKRGVYRITAKKKSGANQMFGEFKK